MLSNTTSIKVSGLALNLPLFYLVLDNFIQESPEAIAPRRAWLRSEYAVYRVVSIKFWRLCAHQIKLRWVDIFRYQFIAHYEKKASIS